MSGAATLQPVGSTPPKRLTCAEYLSLEESSEDKHEYLRGEVWAMAGGTPEHGRIQANLIREIGNALGRRPCVVFSSDVRVHIDASDRTTFRTSRSCGKREASNIEPHAIRTPS